MLSDRREASGLPFSAATRHHNWSALGAQVFDLLVIGGGITGCGIALDAATRGLRVALIEARDLASGTSSRSSRLIHGGLRYLETFELGLIFEASAERRRLLALAPHLVRPLPFLFPVWKGDRVGYQKLRAGLWLYDALALLRNIERHRMLRPAETLAREPALRQPGLRGAGVYYDAAVDDARLTRGVARAAHEAGALVVTYAEARELLLERGRVRGAVVGDLLRGGWTRVQARVTINATGPWSDEVRRLADPAATPRLRPTKGVHLMLPAARVGNRGALIFPSPVDGRVMFVLPARETTYVGTTETEFAGDPATASTDAADEEYLLASANGVFPGAALRGTDVISNWAGVRPLLAARARAERSAGASSREHAVWRDVSGLWNVAGGKLTTYRTMAAEVVDRAAETLRAEHQVASGRSRTAELALPGAPESWPALRGAVRAAASELNLSAATADRLASAYGSEAFDLLRDIAAEPELREPLLPGFPYLLAEVRRAVETEMALGIEDVLQRRIPLLYEAADGGFEAAHRIARFMAGEPGINWGPAELEAQLEAYRCTVQRTRPRTARGDAAPPRPR